MLEDVNLADFAKLLQDTLTELMRLTVGSTAEQRARGVPEELRLEPYPLEYFCVRAMQIDGKPSIPIFLMMSRPAVALMLKLDCFPNAGTAKWRYFVTLPAVVYPVYAVAGRYGHGGLYVLQDRSEKILYEKGLLAKDQSVHACAGPRFIKLKDYKKKNTTYWPTKDAWEAVLGEVHDFEKLFDDDGHPHTPLKIKVPGPREWPACSSTLHLTLETRHVFFLHPQPALSCKEQCGHLHHLPFKRMWNGTQKICSFTLRRLRRKGANGDYVSPRGVTFLLVIM